MMVIYKTIGLCAVGTVASNTIGETYPKAQKFIDMAIAIVGTLWILNCFTETIQELSSMLYRSLISLF